MLAVHLDNLLFLLLIAGIGLLRLLAKKAGGTSEEDQPPPPSPGKTDQTDEERIRKFLEALGQPTSSKPPPPVRPRPAAPVEPELTRQQAEEAARAARRRRLLNPLPPLTTVPPPLPRRVVTPRAPAPPVAEPLPVAPLQTVVVPAYEVSVPGGSETPPPLPVTPKPGEAYSVAKAGPAAALAKLFASRDDLRRAIILREVFGPPRGLQPLDSIGI
ncbi:MAG TPA: hypothetical protein VGG94_00595 [Chthoniobacterales bacterium]